MSHTPSELASRELSLSKLDEEVIQSSAVSSCWRVTSVHVVVAIRLVRDILTLMGLLLGGFENVSEPKEPGLITASALWLE